MLRPARRLALLRELSVAAGDEPYVVHGRALLLGGDLVVVLWGGAAHVGAVGLAQPRPSRRDPRRRGATCSVFTLLGHEEDVVVKRVAERLAAALDRPVVVSAGLHWDDLTADGIARVLAACDECADALLAQLGKEAT